MKNDAKKCGNMKIEFFAIEYWLLQDYFLITASVNGFVSFFFKKKVLFLIDIFSVSRLICFGFQSTRNSVS